MRTFKPCKVTYQGVRYEILTSGVVRQSERVIDDAELAAAVWHEAVRQRRNKRARDRHQALTDLGLVRAPGGAFGGYE